MIAPAMIAAAITLGAVWPVRFEANIRRSHRRGLIPARFRETKRRLMHDPEKWKPVFGKDHAQT
jgi:hypothetical protein